MALKTKRNISKEEAEAVLSRLQELARDRAERLGPYAADARETAAERFYQAREWTAPRLETAALRVEDTVAPRVVELLNLAARKVEPSPPASVLRGRRRLRRSILLLGLGALGAAAAYGAVRLRQNSADAEWQESLNQAREQVREAKNKVMSKAREAQGKAEEAVDAPEGESGSASEFNGRVRK